MPVVEITQLRLKGVTANDTTLLESLSQVRGRLQTNSRFYSCIDESSLIYIFGVWPSLDAHLEFLASPVRNEVLGPQEAILDFQWTIHLEIDVTSSRLFEAPFLAIERFDVDAANIEAFHLAVMGHAQKLRSKDQDPWKITYAWRCDLPTESHEAVVLTTWNSEDCGRPEAVRQITPNDDDNGSFRRILFHRAWNMEHAQCRA
jgi:hypothetical protein